MLSKWERALAITVERNRTRERERERTHETNKQFDDIHLVRFDWASRTKSNFYFKKIKPVSQSVLFIWKREKKNFFRVQCFYGISMFLCNEIPSNYVWLVHRYHHSMPNEIEQPILMKYAAHRWGNYNKSDLIILVHFDGSNDQMPKVEQKTRRKYTQTESSIKIHILHWTSERAYWLLRYWEKCNGWESEGIQRGKHFDTNDNRPQLKSHK